MQPIQALSGIVLVVLAHTTLAGPADPPDPHAQARQLILSTTPHPVAIGSMPASTVLVPADPQELARRRILALPEGRATFGPAFAPESQPAIDPQEQARRAILGSRG